MVVEELVVNIVDYSGSNYMDVEISCEKDRFTMCYRDGGVPFNPLENEPPDFSSDSTAPGGWVRYLFGPHFNGHCRV